jgi:hypothetical protein
MKNHLQAEGEQGRASKKRETSYTHSQFSRKQKFWSVKIQEANYLHPGLLQTMIIGWKAISRWCSRKW